MVLFSLSSLFSHFENSVYLYIIILDFEILKKFMKTQNNLKNIIWKNKICGPKFKKSHLEK